MDVPLKLTFRNLESSESVETRVRERAARLDRFHPRIIALRVSIEVPHRSPGSGKTALAITVEAEVPGRTLVAKASEDMRETRGDRLALIGRAFDAIQRRLEEDWKMKRGAVKVHEAAIETGRVVRLFPQESYGFVEIGGGGDLYFSRGSVANDAFDDLAEGMMVAVTRAMGEGPMGPQASSVRRLGA
ncbi:Ribosome-associated translation inhibitor RaiA [Pseudoxanthobacter soli DSM 19599]|uniref:Ribosome-associated translation inhibitor RaiA n=1 Tax=Pseudoxanthobacter soli DSM 19599 TaxID=1123029 RepID=A0A1M7ZIC0_9HYPH|nr:HPF/RaiA family ribosome-associated protein [Pseudoxanthobacter soli]SHO64641.1 Ribosome-associated translation inhibitor RaiA [Pseudoxanthobacter soli DSM 19599]